MSVETLLYIIVVVLVAIAWDVNSISRRLRKMFPNEYEQESDWRKMDRESKK